MELEVRGIFLSISKAFDKVWFNAVIFKLYQNGICGEMINISQDFLSNRKHRVFFNGQCSSWIDIHARTHLATFVFLIYVNDLSNDIKGKCKLFADDTSLFSAVHGIDTSTNDLIHDLEKFSE